jgi:eukaryotic-like serine/threonine-protein kinase
MPPEQAQGKGHEVDARADIFAVGAVMFRALTGRPVHDAKATTERLFQAMREPAPSLGVIAPHLPAWVVGLVDKALGFDKSEGWATAAEMRAAVRSTFAQLEQAAERVGLGPGAPPSVLDPARDVSALFDAMVDRSIVVDVSFGDAPDADPASD